MATLDQLRLCVDVGLVILIWLVQLVVYPSFAYCETSRFREWHSKYTNRMSLLVVPLMFAQLGLRAFLLFETPSWSNWIALALIAAAWLGTFALSVPCHRKLSEEGYQATTIKRLVDTNWLRTICWTGVPLVAFV